MYLMLNECFYIKYNQHHTTISFVKYTTITHYQIFRVFLFSMFVYTQYTRRVSMWKYTNFLFTNFLIIWLRNVLYIFLTLHYITLHTKFCYFNLFLYVYVGWYYYWMLFITFLIFYTMLVLDLNYIMFIGVN